MRVVAVAALVAALCGCGNDGESPPAQRLAVLSAFPAELAPNVERATISEKVVIEGRVFRVGTLDGVPVVLAMTGIGLVNAAATTRLLLEHFDVKGIVVSAVAGADELPIGDVAVPEAWATKDGTTYAAQPEWLDLARAIAANDGLALERCTLVPTSSDEPVCLLFEPAVVIGGVGSSSDPFGGRPFACVPNSDDLYGCDIEPTPTASLAGFGPHVTPAAVTPVVVDMETAAIAREAALHQLPFIAFRAVSDGSGDPLMLRFPYQFAAYYHLAAHNASVATGAFLKRIAAAARSESS
jgi:nucleoside phosphorylase